MVGGIVAIYLKSIFDSRQSTRFSSPSRSSLRRTGHHHSEDVQLYEQDPRNLRLRRRISRNVIRPPQRQKECPKKDPLDEYPESSERLNDENGDQQVIPSRNSSSSDSTAEDEPFLPPRTRNFDEHGSIGRMEAQMKTKNRMDVMSSRTQSPKQNIVCSNHRKYATKLRVLLMDIKNHKEDFINTNKEDRNNFFLLRGLRELRLLFEKLAIEFRGDRAGYVSSMSLCCNVIMELDALSLLKSLQNLDTDLISDSQFIIEWVVPNIWPI